MTTEKMFEIATRNKFRFPFRGMVTVEDLWDLTPENLDSIFKSLNSQKKRVNEESLLNAKTEADMELDIMINIVKYIVSIKLEEIDARSKAKANKEQAQKIMAILEAKQNKSLEDKSVEELQAMLSELQ